MATWLLSPVTRSPTFDELVAEGIRLLPAHAPEWTNHNASDPGITLIELLAYFTDALLYRLARVSVASRLEFLRLLRGQPDLSLPDGTAMSDAGAIRLAIERALDDLAQLDCAVSQRDHEVLAHRVLAALPYGASTRVRCLPRTDLGRLSTSASDFSAGQDPGHVSVVVFAPQTCPREIETQLVTAVRQGLEPHRLLTTRLHVITPVTVYLEVRLWVTASRGADRVDLARRIAAVLETWRPEEIQAATGTLALAEIADRASAVDGVEGVDRVAVMAASMRRETLHTNEAAIGLQIGLHATVGRDSRLGSSPPLARDRLMRDGDGRLAAFALRPWEALRVAMRPGDVYWSDAAGPATGEAE